MASVAVRSEPPTPPPTALSAASRTYREERRDTLKHAQSLLPPISPLSDQTQGNRSGAHAEGNDFLPMELLVALKRKPQESFPTGRNQASMSPRGDVSKVKRPDSVWQYSSRRSRLKHIVDAPPCVCGSGKDISFLYDKSSPEEPKVEAKKYVPSHTIIPEEYHLVKHPGVLGLQIHDEKFKVSPENHQQHLTVFPSLKPTSRFEAVALRKTLDTMLKHAGIPSELKDDDLKGPTQMHRLLDLVHKEQTIYNIIFHELIRQVSIQCVERGELLAELRKRYAQLLDKIPRQVKGLYNDVVAQKALDKKLNNELRKFKTKITGLTSELYLVKEHDEHVTRESRRAEENLSAAIMSSEKNAELLNEYHGLYELQRYRLEDQVQSLTAERDMWQEAAYGLSRRVTEEYQLRSLRKLQLCEKNWCKLSRHFVIVLSGKDTQQVSEVQELIQEWQEKMKNFLLNMIYMEKKLTERLQRVSNGISKWIEVSKDSISSDGSIDVPSLSTMENLWSEIKTWQEIIGLESEQFSGDALVANQEELKYLSRLMEKWTDICYQVFSRHEETVDAKESPSISVATKDEALKLMKEQSKTMKSILQAIDARLLDCKSRIGGENGVASGFVYLITPLETWDSRLSIILSSADTKSTKFSESEWIKLGKIFHDWQERLEDVTKCIGHVQHPAAITSAKSHESTESRYSDLQNMGALRSSSSRSSSYSSKLNKKSGKKQLQTVEETPEDEAMAKEENKGETEEKKMKGDEKDREKEEKESQEDEEVEDARDYDSMTLEELSAELEAWYYNFSYSLDSLDSELADEVSQMHADHVEWMIRLLLVVTRTVVKKMEEVVEKEQSDETEEGEKDEQPKEIPEYQVELESIATLRDDYRPLAGKMSSITRKITKCCGVIVQELANERAREGYPNPDEDSQDLSRLEEEKSEWVSFSHLLLQKVLQGKDSYVAFKDIDVQPEQTAASTEEAEGTSPGTAELGVKEEEEKERRLKSATSETVASEISIIGEDQNIHQKSVHKAIEEGEAIAPATSSHLGLATEAEMPEGRGSSAADAEHLLIALDQTKALLSEQEEKAKTMEEEVTSKEGELELAKAKIDSLEAELKEARQALTQQQQQKKTSKPLSRGSSKASIKRPYISPGKR